MELQPAYIQTPEQRTSMKMLFLARNFLVGTLQVQDMTLNDLA